MIALPRVLVADPPWRFKDSLPGPKRGASSHYGCLTTADLCNFPLPPLTADATLVLWRVAAMVEDAYKVVRAWGFVPKSELVWVKTTKTGKRHFGMGHYVRAEHECAIIATRGSPKPFRRSTRSVFTAPVGRHSPKPDAFYELVAETWTGPYAELFARRRRGPEWSCFGNELPDVGAEAAE